MNSTFQEPAMQPTIQDMIFPAPPIPQRPSESDLLFEKLQQMPEADKLYLLSRLLRDLFGESPESEWTICKGPGIPHMHLLSPPAFARLLLTPERLARWAKETAVDPAASEELRRYMNENNEEKVREWIERHKP
jgi:hypothetical protein